MLMIVRILGLSLIAGGLGAAVGQMLFGHYGDASIPSLVLGCTGAIIGAVAGAAREISSALRHRAST